MQDFNFRRATANDLNRIVSIYNDVVLDKTSTAGTRKISPEHEREWFRKISKKSYPIVAIEYNNKIIGWMSFNKVSDNPDFNHVAEILIFVDRNFRGKKMFQELVERCIEEAPKYNIKILLALFLKNDEKGKNTAILPFKKFGFKKWGIMPGVISFDDQKHNLLVYGKKF